MMNISGKKKIHLSQFKNYAWILAVVWTIFIIASLIWNVVHERQDALENALIQARISYEKDILYRRWNASHGGVYVPVTNETQPNPYLSHIPERDIKTPTGELLTLINPACMTRQVNELIKKETGISGHITSLKPIRPENAPDPWEARALESFEHGKTEISSIERIEGKDCFRLMRHFITEEACLKCHGAQGYKTGDIRGGISVSIPMEPLWAIMRGHIRTLMIAHGLLWLLGIGGIIFGAQKIGKSEQNYQNLFINVPIGLYRTSPKGEIIDVNPALLEILGYIDRTSLLGMNTADTYANPEDRIQWKTLMEREGGVHNYQKQLQRMDGKIIWVNENTQAIRDAEGRTLCYEGSFEDITERKLAEEALKESEAKYRALAEQIPAITYIADLDEASTTLYISPQILSILGVSQTEYMADSDYWRKHVHSDDYDRVRAEVALSHAQGQKFESEYRMLAKDGRIVWIRDEAMIMPNDTGKPLCLQGIMQDITQHKRMEEEREELIHGLQEALAKVKKLSGLLPICASCKKIRDDKGYWNQIESYIQEHSEADFSHGICPECARKLYPDLYKEK